MIATILNIEKTKDKLDHLMLKSVVVTVVVRVRKGREGKVREGEKKSWMILERGFSLRSLWLKEQNPILAGVMKRSWGSC